MNYKLLLEMLEKNQTSETLQMDGMGGGVGKKGNFYKSNNCVLNFAVESSRNL